MCFTPKPGLSNLTHFITPVIRPLLPHRTTCSVPSSFMPTVLPVQCISAGLCSRDSRDQHVSCPGNLRGLSPELAPAASEEGWRRNWGLLGQELQDERHPHKRNPDGGIDGWVSREESLSHPLSWSYSSSVSFSGGAGVGCVWCIRVVWYNRYFQLNLIREALQACGELCRIRNWIS